MAKIYNEIVIDMNPESLTFEETIYEDSFEYSGDMILTQGEEVTIGTPEAGYTYRFRKLTKNASGGYDEEEWEDKFASTTAFGGKPEEGYTYSGGKKTGQIDSVQSKKRYKKYTWDASNNSFKSSGTTYEESPQHYATMQAASAAHVEGGSTDWGAADISKDDFIDPETGQERTIEQIYGLLDPKLPNLTGEPLKLQIRDMLPKYKGASKEEKGFAKEGFQADVYGISKEAGKAGQQMQKAYGSGMGSSMRGAVGAGKDVAQQFKQAEQGYAQDIYGLEKGAGEKFEAGVSDWMQDDWFETPESGVPKISGFEQGGRVPSKESFLEVLTKLPDAGGS